jgi:hypothetical protein
VRAPPGAQARPPACPRAPGPRRARARTRARARDARAHAAHAHAHTRTRPRASARPRAYARPPARLRARPRQGARGRRVCDHGVCGVSGARARSLSSSSSSDISLAIRRDVSPPGRSAPASSNNVLAACARAAAGDATFRHIACKVSLASSTGSVTASRLVSTCTPGATETTVEGPRRRGAVIACPNPS